MATYVLILLMITDTPRPIVTSVEFGNAEACEAAGKSAQEKFRARMAYVAYTCVKKY